VPKNAAPNKGERESCRRKRGGGGVWDLKSDTCAMMGHLAKLRRGEKGRGLEKWGAKKWEGSEGKKGGGHSSGKKRLQQYKARATETRNQRTINEEKGCYPGLKIRKAKKKTKREGIGILQRGNILSFLSH